jgi:hypothetical protein
MKHLLITFIVTIIFFESCRKIDDVEILLSGPMEYGKITAQLNNKNWAASAEARNEADKKDITIIASTYLDKEATFETERLGLTIPNKLGRYKKFVASGYSYINTDTLLVTYHLMEADVPILSFKLDTNKSSNYVEVTALDSTHIVGTFDLTFKALTNGGKKELTYRFKDGNFDVKITK